MPEKFIKLLSLIHDQLYYEPDHLVVINETECLSLGLNTADVQQNLASMREQGLVGFEKSHMASVNSSKPTGERKISEKPDVFIDLFDGLFGEVNHINNMHWVLLIPVTLKFDDFYEKNIDRNGDKEEDYIGLKFDSKESVLIIRNQKILISKKNDKNNGHYILEYIFNNEDGLNAKYYYSEILEECFRGESNWRKCYRACQDINSKVLKQTKEKIDDFLVFRTGKSGYIEIESKYLLSS